MKKLENKVAIITGGAGGIWLCHSKRTCCARNLCQCRSPRDRGWFND